MGDLYWCDKRCTEKLHKAPKNIKTLSIMHIQQDRRWNRRNSISCVVQYQAYIMIL